MVIRTLACLLLLLLSRFATAVEARLDLPDPLIPGAAMTGELIISDGEAPTKLTLPQVAGLRWEVQQGGRQETRIINGVRSSTHTVVLGIEADKEGTYALPAFPVSLRDGSSVTVPATQVRCAPGEARLTGDLVTEARFVPDHIVPGEAAQLVYTIWLKRGEIQTLGINPPPEALTLGERQLNQSRAMDREGQPWAKVVVTWPLTFSQPGSYKVAGQQECRIAVGDGIFDNRVQVKRVAVAAATITVAELPQDGRPSDFTGLIGAVAVESRLDRNAIAAGEGARFELVVRTRQADLVRRPTLALPAGVAGYPIENGPEDPAGTRTFRWDVVPAAPGEITMPTIAIPWFDPATKTYRNAASAPLTLTVRPGRARDLGLVGATAAPSATAQTPSSSAQPQGLPAPFHVRRSDPPAIAIAAGAAAAGLALGAVVGLLARRPRRGPHRGRSLAAAIDHGDTTAIQIALAALRPALTAPAALAAAERLQVLLEAQRFGGAALPPAPELHALATPLEAIP